MNVDAAITHKELAAIHALIAHCDDGTGAEPFNSHGALTRVTMLFEDIALIVPAQLVGGRQRAHVLAAHGYT